MKATEKIGAEGAGANKELKEFKELKAFEDTGLLSLALKGCLGAGACRAERLALDGLGFRGLRA